MSEARVLQADQIVYSADSHVVEPRDLWTNYIDPGFRDRAPHIETSITREDGSEAEGEFMVCEGIRPQPIASFAAADVSDPRERSRANQRGYAEIRQGGWDPAARRRDQDVDGVSLEIVYPSMAMPMFGISDVPYQQAVFRAYNSWVADFQAELPGRLFGIAMISLEDITAGIAELERTRVLGLRGAMIWNDPGQGRNYGDLEFDPFWAAAADFGMPISLHILTGREGHRARERPIPDGLHGPPPRSAAVPHRDADARRLRPAPGAQGRLGRERHRLARPLPLQAEARLRTVPVHARLQGPASRRWTTSNRTASRPSRTTRWA